MNTAQKIRLNMQLTVRNFVNMNEVVAKSIPKFMESYSVLQGITSEIQEIAILQGTDKTGVAIDKNKLKKTLIEMTAKYSRKVAALAKFLNSDELLNEVMYSQSHLRRLAETTLIEKATSVYTRAEENIGALAEYSINPETQKGFKETITALNSNLKTPRSTLAERKKATERLAVLFESAEAAIERMDFAVGIVRDEQTDFYNAYKTARKLVYTNRGKVALKAKATDLATGTPLTGVLFIFKLDGFKPESVRGKGTITKKTASKGSFQIRNMQSGTYRVLVQKPGYKEQEVSVSIMEGERSNLYVGLEK